MGCFNQHSHHWGPHLLVPGPLMSCCRMQPERPGRSARPVAVQRSGSPTSSTEAGLCWADEIGDIVMRNSP